ncbi:hypothetical protein KAR34_13300, partial [bacterium]|nr:hypothetical protein [bacterium]
MMESDFVANFISGNGRLGGGKEVFVTAADDIVDIKMPRGLGDKLTLRKSKYLPFNKDTSDTVIVFKKNSDNISSPIQTSPKRWFGFKGKGTTKGGAREWVAQNDNLSGLQKQGFEIQEIYTLDKQGRKIQWDIAVKENGKYTVTGFTVSGQSGKNAGLEKTLTRLQSEIGNEHINVGNVDSIGGKNMKQMDTGNTRFLEKSPKKNLSPNFPPSATKSSASTLSRSLSLSKGSKGKSLVKAAGVALVTGALVGGTTKAVAKSVGTNTGIRPETTHPAETTNQIESTRAGPEPAGANLVFARQSAQPVGATLAVAQQSDKTVGNGRDRSLQHAVQSASSAIQQSTKSVTTELTSKYHIWGHIAKVAPEVRQMAQELGIEKEMAGLLEGASLGDFMKDGIVNAWSIIGQIAMNFVPIADQGSDIRDIGAAIKNLINNQGKKLGDWGNLGLNGIRFVPLIGLITFGPKIYKHADEFKSAIKSLITNNKAFAKVFKALEGQWKGIKEFAANLKSNPVKFADKVKFMVKSRLRKFGILKIIKPENGLYARVVDEGKLLEILDGKKLSFDTNVKTFIAPLDDIADVRTGKEMGKRCTLLKMNGDLRKDGNVVIVFKMSKENANKVMDKPVTTHHKGFKNYGQEGGNLTKGGSREWDMKNCTLDELKTQGGEIKEIYKLTDKGGKEILWKPTAATSKKMSLEGTEAIKSQINKKIEILKSSENKLNSSGLAKQEMKVLPDAKIAGSSGSIPMKAKDMKNMQSTPKLPPPKPSLASRTSKTKSSASTLSRSLSMSKGSKGKSLVKAAGVAL